MVDKEELIMSILNRQPKFVAATCPKCGGVLELDASFEVAYCSECGTQCFIQNVKKRKIKKTPLDKVIGFVERQQQIKRQDRIEKKQKEEEEQRKAEEWLKNYWWIFLVVFVALFTFIGIMSYLEG